MRVHNRDERDTITASKMMLKATSREEDIMNECSAEGEVVSELLGNTASLKSSVSVPIVSIVIPAYKAARFLPMTIESVRAQSISDWEVVVVDDGSPDNTYEIAQGFAEADPRIRVVRQQNLKDAAARNRGYAESNPDSEFVIFLDSDDVWEVDTLQTLINALEKNPDLVAAYGQASYIDGNGEFIRPGELEAQQGERYQIENGKLVELPEDAPTNFSTHALCPLGGRITTPGLVLVRRKAVDRTELFDTTIKHCADWRIFLQLLSMSDFAFVNKRVLRYRQHGGNKSSNAKTMAEAYIAVRNKLLVDPLLSDDQRRIARQAYRFYSMSKLKYSRECFANREWALGIKQIARGFKSYLKYCLAVLKTRSYRPKVDRPALSPKPLPK